jgi:hypothetical protein
MTIMKMKVNAIKMVEQNGQNPGLPWYLRTVKLILENELLPFNYLRKINSLYVNHS